MRQAPRTPLEPATSTSLQAPARRGFRRVFVRDLELMASVGVFEVERRYEQRIVVSIELLVIDDYDGTSDRLADVVDYGEIVAKVRAVVDAGHVSLIETLAERIAGAVLEDGRIALARVRIEKPDAMPGCRAVGIEIERQGGC